MALVLPVSGIGAALVVAYAVARLAASNLCQLGTGLDESLAPNGFFRTNLFKEDALSVT